jgi:molybdate transport system substrate-binding protein
MNVGKYGFGAALAAALGAMLMTGSTVRSAELRVLSAGAVTEAVSEIAERFHAEDGTVVATTFGTVGAIEDKLRQGTPADVLILSAPALEAQERAGKIVPGSRAELGRVGIGVAVREGVPRPDIATAESFKRALLAARSLVYADPAKGASSGIYFAELLGRLGIADAVKEKTTLLPGGYVVELVAKGGAEIGVHQISEILPVKGVTLVGPLPPELQKYTVYAAGVTTDAAAPDRATALIKRLTGPAGRATFTRAGFEPPG